MFKLQLFSGRKKNFFMNGGTTGYCIINLEQKNKKTPPHEPEGPRYKTLSM
jgi:hypothetical protein